MAKAKLDINSFIARTDALTKDYDNYTDQFVTRAHKELYALLANIYQVCLDVIHNPNQAELRKLMRTRMKESLNTRISNETRTVPLVVRYITRASAKTRHVYSRVFETAIEAGIAAEKLPAFIEEHGGIDKAHKATTIALSRYTKYIEKKASDIANMKLAYSLARERNIGTVNFTAGVPAIASDVEFFHLLCHYDTTAKKMTLVLAPYPSSDVEQQVLKNFTLALQCAAVSDKQGFKETCEDNGLHDDHVLFWMKSNSIRDAAHARELLEFSYAQFKEAAITLDEKAKAKATTTSPATKSNPIDVESETIEDITSLKVSVT